MKYVIKPDGPNPLEPDGNDSPELVMLESKPKKSLPNLKLDPVQYVPDLADPVIYEETGEPLIQKTTETPVTEPALLPNLITESVKRPETVERSEVLPEPPFGQATAPFSSVQQEVMPDLQLSSEGGVPLAQMPESNIIVQNSETGVTADDATNLTPDQTAAWEQIYLEPSHESVSTSGGFTVRGDWEEKAVDTAAPPLDAPMITPITPIGGPATAIPGVTVPTAAISEPEPSVILLQSKWESVMPSDSSPQAGASTASEALEATTVFTPVQETAPTTPLDEVADAADEEEEEMAKTWSRVPVVIAIILAVLMAAVLAGVHFFRVFEEGYNGYGRDSSVVSSDSNNVVSSTSDEVTDIPVFSNGTSTNMFTSLAPTSSTADSVNGSSASGSSVASSNTTTSRASTASQAPSVSQTIPSTPAASSPETPAQETAAPQETPAASQEAESSQVQETVSSEPAEPTPSEPAESSEWNWDDIAGSEEEN